ncbi:MAG TPA: alpha-amylase/4-alpha-glucanotransferase domain-containing protein, partial [Actinomycetota bacterium]|nr:alpha-amylase/4-alpha-glucanotransferase domain-containing protein [Actinomycetota bacterium]
ADPTGLWLTERVWEQDVVPALLDAGVRYTVVDDTMFHGVGVTDEDLTGAFVTEQDGRPLLLYAGDRRLRYLIPYRKVARVIEHVTGDDRLYVYADDGEKFGEWPDTHERVYGEGWLESLFTALEEADGVTMVTLGEHAREAVPVGRVYLPSSSYDEMMTWALPPEPRLKLGKARRALEKEDPEGLLPFLRGAPWRSFFAKYPEVNHLQKRMLMVSRALRAGDNVPDDALKELYRAQCNCAYWHGAFGGVYLSFMRGALWHHLMKAEAMVGRPTAAAVREVDVDADARPEIVVTAPWGVAVFAPHRGGSMIELDDWRGGANLLAVVARHREAYHLADENPPPDDLDDDEMAAIQARSEVDRDSLVFDEAGHGALIDLIDGARVDESYEYEVDGGGRVRMWVESGGLRIEKAAVADADELLTTYTLTNVSGTSLKATFGSRASVMPLVLGRDVGSDIVESTSTSWRVGHPEAEVGLAVEVSNPASIATEDLATASATLEGLQSMHQGTQVTMEWALDLEPGAEVSFELRWRPEINDAALAKKDRGVSAGV